MGKLEPTMPFCTKMGTPIGVKGRWVRDGALANLSTAAEFLLSRLADKRCGRGDSESGSQTVGGNPSAILSHAQSLQLGERIRTALIHSGEEPSRRPLQSDSGQLIS
jgi:hypothetical protein